MYRHTSLLILLVIVFCGCHRIVYSQLQQEVSITISTIDCKQTLCARPDCHNPVIPTGQCCPICPLDCSFVLCAAPDCPDSITPPGKCCPICSNCSAVLCQAELACPNPVTPPGKCCPECPDCSAIQCPRPLCANPTLKPGECCSSCEDSNCNFKGCVNFLPDGSVQWSPNPCSICQCRNNQQFCAIIDCFFPSVQDCFGYPVITKLGECCPRCDFGVANDTCEVVPQLYGQQNITVSSTPGSNSCSKTVVKRTCDKFSFRSAGGEKFRCDPIQGRRVLRFNRGCPLNKATFRDITRCKVVHDDSVVAGCDLTVD